MFFLETGLVLLVAPWLAFWERNLLVETSPVLGSLTRLAVVRGAVSGVGLVNVCAGLWELVVSLTALVRRVRGRGGRTAQHGRGTSPVDGTGSGTRGEDTRPWAQGR